MNSSDLIELHKEAHQKSDKDFDATSQHHTLGKGPTQAAAGNHTHPDLEQQVAELLVEIELLQRGLFDPGDMKLSAKANDSTFWFVCDGRALSRTVYATLFAAIGTTYGPGDGTTTFNIPNVRGRVPVGLDPAQTEFNALDKFGGTKVETLTIEQMPSHTHIPGNNDRFQTTTRVGSPAKRDDIPGYTSGAYITAWGSTDNASFVSETASAGGGQSHNNLPPYIVLNYLIRVT